MNRYRGCPMKVARAKTERPRVKLRKRRRETIAAENQRHNGPRAFPRRRSPFIVRASAQAPAPLFMRSRSFTLAGRKTPAFRAWRPDLAFAARTASYTLGCGCGSDWIPETACCAERTTRVRLYTLRGKRRGNLCGPIFIVRSPPRYRAFRARKRSARYKCTGGVLCWGIMFRNDEWLFRVFRVLDFVCM